jgi:hypothetical protein
MLLVLAHGSEPLAVRNESRADPPPPRRLSLVLGAVVLVGVGGALAAKLVSPRPAHVPLGIAGFTLGGKLADARQGLPGVVERRPGLWVASASVFETPAECELGAVRPDTITSIDCTLSGSGPAELQRRRLLATLRSLYGAETRTTHDEIAERWVWENARATLVLRQSIPASPGSLRLTNRLEAGAD